MKASVCISTAAAVLLAAGAALAQGTSAQRSACTSDVFRLCASEIPDVQAIVVCLRQHKPSLSPACQQVFTQLDGGRPAQRSAIVEASDVDPWCASGAGGQDEWVKWCTRAR